VGDPRRFDAFAALIAERITPEARIVDVAGGKGYLQAALRQRGYRNVTSWDKRKKYASNTRGYRYGWFTHDTPDSYDVVVAMHPDGGTDHAICYAARNKVPALVVPCCAIGGAVAYGGAKCGYESWIEHLERLARERGLGVEREVLPIVGRRLVLVCRP
jgi:hypothetical protein